MTKFLGQMPFTFSVTISTSEHIVDF